jgi:hypothetical protein
MTPARIAADHSPITRIQQSSDCLKPRAGVGRIEWRLQDHGALDAL